METEKPKETQAEIPTHEALLQSEWATIKQLEKMLVDPELTIKERTSVANVLAYHANTLNKLLGKKSDKDPIEDQTLGDFIMHMEPRIARSFRRDYRVWQRTLSAGRRQFGKNL